MTLDDDNNLAYVFNMDNFICDLLPENMDLPSVEQAAANADWQSFCTELFSTVSLRLAAKHSD
jgi:hypothetical protein